MTVRFQDNVSNSGAEGHMNLSPPQDAVNRAIITLLTALAVTRFDVR